VIDRHPCFIMIHVQVRAAAAAASAVAGAAPVDSGAEQAADEEVVGVAASGSLVGVRTGSAI
jgi:hypothetical protein